MVFVRKVKCYNSTVKPIGQIPQGSVQIKASFDLIDWLKAI